MTATYFMETVQVNTPMLGEQTDSVNTSTVPMGRDEIEPALDAEFTMHLMAGWKVRRLGMIVVAAKVREGEPTLVVRVIYAVEADPALDGSPEAMRRPVLGPILDALADSGPGFAGMS